jgi:hypothetical protein
MLCTLQTTSYFNRSPLRRRPIRLLRINRRDRFLRLATGFDDLAGVRVGDFQVLSLPLGFGVTVFGALFLLDGHGDLMNSGLGLGSEEPHEEGYEVAFLERSSADGAFLGRRSCGFFVLTLILILVLGGSRLIIVFW